MDQFQIVEKRLQMMQTGHKKSVCSCQFLVFGLQFWDVKTQNSENMSPATWYFINKRMSFVPQGCAVLSSGFTKHHSEMEVKPHLQSMYIRNQQVFWLIW